MNDPKQPGPDGLFRHNLMRKAIKSIGELAQDAEPKTERQLSFECSGADMLLIKRIAHRACEIALALDKVKFDPMRCSIDIAACHCNGTPLHLLRFLMSDQSDFMHDFGGIGVHLNRRTGQLMNDFVPHCAVQKS